MKTTGPADKSCGERMIATIRFETNQSEQEIKTPEKTNFRKNVELDDNGLIIGLRAIQLLIGSDFLVLQHEGFKYNTDPPPYFPAILGQWRSLLVASGMTAA